MIGQNGAMPDGTTAVPITGDDDADRLLADEPLALLIGMLLNQQMPLERAFHAPYDLKERLGGRLDAAAIASADPDVLADLFAEPPALHRASGPMASRTQEVCRTVVNDYGGDAAAIWTTAATGEDLFFRLSALPGFGAQKARVLMIILSDHLGVAPPGTAEVTGPQRNREFFSISPAPKTMIDGKWTRVK